MPAPKQVLVSGGFDDIKSRDIRFLEGASKLGAVTVLLWPDAALERLTGNPPKFPLAERSYFLNAVRFVTKVIEADPVGDFNALPKGLRPDVWADYEPVANTAREQSARQHGIFYRVFGAEDLKGFPEPPLNPFTPGRKRVIVTGCYDWFHSGHVRFFEEVSARGDLIVCLGHDANIRKLKGENHPLLSHNERRYLVGSIKFVTQSLICTGHGWVDAEPEILRLKPDIYAVNEDGDKGGKREYCANMGLQYLVLKRIPAPGLPRRNSTDLRGF
jgi:cytidyltransferase-like protein